MSSFKLECENLSCRFSIRQGHRRSDHHFALKSINFSMREGERVGFIGSNGAGKSTLLKILARLMYPTSGRLKITGHPKMALVNLSSGMFPTLSGRENAMLTCMMAGLRKREAAEKIEAIIDFSELDEWIDRPVMTYSSGMLSRLGMAVALQVRPEVLFLDEVLGVGDARFQKKSNGAMMKMVGQAQSVGLVSHDMNAIKTICDRVIWMDGGHLRADGPSGQVLAAYQHWVATAKGRG